MSDNNQRIVRNTGLLYIRSVLCFALSLVSSRLILRALGIEDYGIYNAVGGFVSMFWMVASVLTSAVSRFLNVEMGRNNMDGIKEVFSVSLNMMFLLALLAALLAEGGGIWFLTKKMSIPPERMIAATWVFHLSIFTMVISFITIPYDAAQLMHEAMGITAFINIAQAILTLGIALLLCYRTSNSDNLILYAILTTVSTVIIRVGDILYTRHRFQECRFRLILKTKKLKEMLGFAWWNFIGSVAGTFSGQGVNMALNVYQGPILNTARGLANTVNNAVSMLVYNFNLSIKPQIMQSYAREDRSRVNSLVFTGTKFSSYLMMLFMIPLAIETPFVLKIWLVDFPDYTIPFVRLALLASFIYGIDTHFITAKMADGKIVWYQIITSAIVFLTFPLSTLALHAGYDPLWIYYALLVTSFAKSIVTIVSVKPVLDFKYKDCVFRILTPILLVGLLSCSISLAVYHVIAEGWLRFIAVGFISVICTIGSSLYVGCTKEERNLLLGIVREKKRSRRSL